MLGVKMSQVQILLVLYLLIAEDFTSAPLLFKNPACSWENIMPNTSSFQWSFMYVELTEKAVAGVDTY